jgi:hypothetical protein
MAIPGAKHYLLLVSLLNQDLIVSIMEIKLSKVLGANKLVYKLVNLG